MGRWARNWRFDGVSSVTAPRALLKTEPGEEELLLLPCACATFLPHILQTWNRRAALRRRRKPWRPSLVPPALHPRGQNAAEVAPKGARTSPRLLGRPPLEGPPWKNAVVAVLAVAGNNSRLLQQRLGKKSGWLLKLCMPAARPSGRHPRRFSSLHRAPHPRRHP
jgi:hypothetical protein